MKVLEYEIIDSDNSYEIGQTNVVVLFETKQDNEENMNYVEQGCDNNTLAGQRWNEYLYEKTGLCDEDVFYFMQSGEEQTEWELDGIKMKLKGE